MAGVGVDGGGGRWPAWMATLRPNETMMDKCGGIFNKILSTKDTDHPITCKVGMKEVPPGWDAGWIGMRVGEERSIVMPASEAWGEEGYEPWGVPSNSIMNVSVKCVAVNPSPDDHGRDPLLAPEPIQSSEWRPVTDWQLGLDDGVPTPTHDAGVWGADMVRPAGRGE
eukprot:gene32494-56373_t